MVAGSAAEKLIPVTGERQDRTESRLYAVTVSNQSTTPKRPNKRTYSHQERGINGIEYVHRELG